MFADFFVERVAVDAESCGSFDLHVVTAAHDLGNHLLLDTADDLGLRRMVFDDADALREAAAALSNAGVYYETVDAAGGRGASIAYYAFDQDEIAAVCSGGRVSEP